MRRLAAVIWVTLAVTGACDDNSNGGASKTTSTDGALVVIHTAGMAFDPATTSVSAGTTVRWMNDGAVAHTVTSGTGSAAADAGQLFDQPVGPGQTFEYTFKTPGTFAYFCRPHESMGMRGAVTVTGGGSGGTGGTGTGGRYTY